MSKSLLTLAEFNEMLKSDCGSGIDLECLELIQHLWYNKLDTAERMTFLQELRDGETKVRITDSEIKFGAK